MNILIVGAGEVGSHLARLLSRENHDITVIDHDPDKIAGISETLDVLAIEGSGTSPSVLNQASIRQADMVIAVTTVDEVNMLVCMIAKQFGVKTIIARVRNQEFSEDSTIIDPSIFGIDQMIHPEAEATREIVRLIRYPQVMEMLEFCSGRIRIAGLKIKENSPIAGREIREIGASFSDFRFRFVAIQRAGNTIIPYGEHKIEIGDDLYISCREEDLQQIFTLTGHSEKKSRHVMIYGASAVGKMVAQALDDDPGVHIKLLEKDRNRGQQAAEELMHSSVVIGEASDIDLITREGIIDQDVYAALTNDDEENIVTSLLARHLQVPKTITLIGKADYIPIVKTIGLDIAVNTRLLTSNAIFKFIHRGKVLNLRHMVSIDAETIEFKVGAESKVVGKQIQDIPFPKGAIAVAVEHESGSEIPIGSTKLFVGDQVVIFTLPQSLQSVINLFE